MDFIYCAARPYFTKKNKSLLSVLLLFIMYYVLSQEFMSLYSSVPHVFDCSNLSISGLSAKCNVDLLSLYLFLKVKQVQCNDSRENRVHLF